MPVPQQVQGWPFSLPMGHVLLLHAWSRSAGFAAAVATEGVAGG
jgi:hypothetical protein